MGRFVLRRLLQAIPLLLIISLILFVMMQQMGDPLATFGGRNVIKSGDRLRLTRQLGLDKPLPVQYAVWLIGNDWMKLDLDGDGIPESYGTRLGVLRGDLGTSYVTRQPVLEMIGERLPNTLLLMLTSELVILVFSLAIGLISALKQYSLFDHTVTTLSFIGFSMPVPLLALGLIYVFAVNLKRWGLPYFPTGGMFDPSAGRSLWQTLWHMVLPVMTLSVVTIAGYSRYVRSNMLEVLNQDYIRTAHAKGLAKRRVVLVHALKNAAMPLVTIVGMDLP
jgi:peptide/nickel transport system permease protein